MRGMVSKTELERIQIQERANEQQRADERDERERHLHDDERAPQQGPRRAVAPAALLQARPVTGRRDIWSAGNKPNSSAVETARAMA